MSIAQVSLRVSTVERQEPMTRQPYRRPRPTPFVDPETRRRLRELELAESRLDRLRSQAPARMGRF